ncbi:Rhodanese-like domain-containing protein, partial [Obelidium mucronatum]
VTQTLTPEDLVSWLRDEKWKAHKDYLIVDVRPRFDGGNIATAVNIPREEFNEADKALLAAPRKLVFHCHHSLHKGPASAANYLKTVGASEGQEVYVLEGGYAKWAEVYSKEKDLVENLKKDEG